MKFTFYLYFFKILQEIIYKQDFYKAIFLSIIYITNGLILQLETLYFIIGNKKGTRTYET